MASFPMDFGPLGIQAAFDLCATDTSYRSFQKAGQTLFETIISFTELVSIRFYVYHPSEQTFHEEAYIDRNGDLQGNDKLPLYHLPEILSSPGESVTRFHGMQQETLITLGGPMGLTGLLSMLFNQPVPDELLSEFKKMATGLSLGVSYILHARQAKRTAMISRAASRMGRELQGVSGHERLLSEFVHMAVDQLGFDRATLFILGEDGQTVRRALCASTGQDVMELKKYPELPRLTDEPRTLESVPGFWLPLRAGNRCLAILLVDNLYTLEAPPEDATQILLDLSGQVALSLENALLVDRLREVALRDDLTGLYRPGYFYERLQEELANLSRQRGTAGLLVLDVDFFKQINDNFGHPAGDAVLIQASALIRNTLRASDLACRMGGDEFLILAPGLNPEQGQRLAQRILKTIHQHDFVLPNGNKTKVSTSIGLATYPDNASTWEQLLYRADEALYQSKNDGRGRVSISMHRADEL